MKKTGFIRYAEKIFQSQPSFRADLGNDRHFEPATLYGFLDSLKGKFPSGSLAVKLAGSSAEGRPVNVVTLGNGSIPVLLWSQMHGDEPTATAAIADILLYFTQHTSDEEVHILFSSLTLHFLPLVNPDGASRRQRRNAQNIDVNRDALALQSPEGILLKKMQQTIKPVFGFNLHDQELSTVGSSRELTSLALLAPAHDEEKSDNDVRTKAKQLAAAFASSMNLFIEGKIAKYDDAFEPRAFGDSYQKSGTSTLLVESGHARNDPQKEFLRRLNVTGILSALFSIATGEYLQAPIETYTTLPFNSKRAYEKILRNVTVRLNSGGIIRADLGLSSQVDTHSEPPLKLVDIGDLSTFAGLDERDMKGLTVSQNDLRIGEPLGPPILNRL